MTQQSVMPFNYGDKKIRVIVDEQQNPWWVAKDICKVLGFENPRQALATHLDDDEKGVHNLDTPGGLQQLAVISESGLYTLIIRSNKPQAKAFRKWVTSEVLPAIRKTGVYQQPDAARLKKPESLLPVAREFRAALRLARAMGLKGTQAVHAASRLAGDLTGFEPLALFDAADFAEPDGKGAAPRRK